MDAAEVRIVNTQPEHFETLAALQHVIFADIPGEEAFTVEMYAQHIQHFPDGQFTALLLTDQGEQVVGATTTMRTNETFDGDEHPYYFDFIGQGTISTHDLDGEWLYGIDVGVHPEFRGLGIGRRLYDARRELVRRLNLTRRDCRGAAARLSALSRTNVRRGLCAAGGSGQLNDPTLSMQLRMGFTLRKLLYNYVTDPRSDSAVSLIVRENPYYQR